MKIEDIFKQYKKQHLEVVYTNNTEQNELVTVLEYFGYHFETRTPLREYCYQDNSKFNSYSFWGKKFIAIGYFDETLNWYSKPIVMRYEYYHPVYEQIMKERNKYGKENL